MKKHKMLRLFKMSLLAYVVNFKRNIFLTISVAVSILLFLCVSLFLDFHYATYAKGNSRVQDNYVPLFCDSLITAQKCREAIPGSSVFTCQHTTMTGLFLTEEEEGRNVIYNTIVCDKIPNDVFIYSALDRYGEEWDYSNSKNFEKVSIIQGRNFFQGENEVIVSDAYGRMLGKTPSELIGQDVVMRFDDTSKVYRIVGVFDSFLAEERINAASLQAMQTEEKSTLDNTALLFTVLIPPGTVPESSYMGWDYYYFFNTAEEYSRIVGALSKMDENPYVGHDYSYYTPTMIQADNDAEWTVNLQMKCLLLLIVAIISGLSVFGTMFNSIADRKKEIGIKKALGASDSDIMAGFLIENLINSLVAIVIASALAALLFLGYAFYQRQLLMADYTVAFYPITLLLFVCFALSNVLGFSLIPAYHATQVNVIDTLRDE